MCTGHGKIFFLTFWLFHLELFINLLNFILHGWVLCLCVCLCTTWVTGTHEEVKPSDTGVKVVVDHCTGAGDRTRVFWESSWRSFLTAEPSLQATRQDFKIMILIRHIGLEFWHLRGRGRRLDSLWVQGHPRL